MANGDPPIMRTNHLGFTSLLLLSLAACGGAETSSPSTAHDGDVPGATGAEASAPAEAPSAPPAAPAEGKTPPAGGETNPATPDFTIAAPSRVTVRRGQSATFEVKVARTGGAAGPVALSLDGVPVGVLATVKPIADGLDSATVTLTAGPGADQQIASLAIHASLGTITHDASSVVTVGGLAGELDTTYGAAGKASFALSGSVADMVVLPDGRLILGGNIAGEAVVARLSRTGQLDTTFGDQGLARVPRPAGFSDELRHVSVLSNGDIAISGERTESALNRDRGLAARFDAEGKIDATFGAAGVLAFAAVQGGDTSFSGGVFEGADGSLFATGYTSVTSKCAVLVTKLDHGGAPDTSFGTGGVRRIEPPTAPDSDLCTAHGVALPAGGFVLAGTAYGNVRMAAAKFDAQGNLDGSFGTGGFTLVGGESTGAWSGGIALAPDGKIVLAGYAWGSGSEEMTFARLGADGKLDASFGNGGRRTVDVGPFRSGAYSVKVAPDGSVYATGYAEPAKNEWKLAAVRLGPDGNVDPAFGTNGAILAPQQTSSYAIALDADGRLLAGTYFPDIKNGGLLSFWQ